MAEQSERADLARVYRAIGNSKAPMPFEITAVREGYAILRFRKDELVAVQQWADALDGMVVRGATTYSEGTANAWHEFGSRPSGGSRGASTDLPGWTFDLWCEVSGPSPRVPIEAAPITLGTGDEPADVAIVPAGEAADPVQDWYFTWGAGQRLPDGSDAENHYTIVCGTYASARAEMMQRFGNTWCDQYGSHQAAGVDQFRLKRVLPVLWPVRFEPDGVTPLADDVAPNAGSAS